MRTLNGKRKGGFGFSQIRGSRIRFGALLRKHFILGLRESRVRQFRFEANKPQRALFSFDSGKGANFTEPLRAGRRLFGSLNLFLELRDIDRSRSEERRVGKECRYRGSP